MRKFNIDQKNACIHLIIIDSRLKIEKIFVIVYNVVAPYRIILLKLRVMDNFRRLKTRLFVMFLGI